MELIKQTGVDWVRAEFHWSRIQPAPGREYSWREYDVMVDSFAAAGIKVLGILTYIPETLLRDWTVIDQQFQRFAEAAVRRYSPKGVHYWEVFNEPNLTGFGWLTRQHDARDFLGAYTLLLARANKVLRDNDPLGVLVLGGLASDMARGIQAEEAMEVIYRAGASECFDIFAFHPYGYQNQFRAARTRMVSIMRSARDLGKPLWFNEYGWTDYAAMDMSVNKTADMNPMMAVFSQRNEADALFWFTAKDYSDKPRTPAFGLADFRLNKRASFWTFKYLVDQVNQAGTPQNSIRLD
jgi:hypothetical protein